MKKVSIWLPVIRAGSGSDVYTLRLHDALKRQGFNTKITWFNHFWELLPILKKGSIPSDTDIIIANTWNAFAFKHPSIPLISIAHHCVFDSQFSKYKTKSQKLYHDTLIYHYEKKSLIKSDKVIAVSNYTATSYQKMFPYKEIEVIHNWIDVNLFNTNNNYKAERIKRILFIGNWSRRKGADLIPSIFQNLGTNYELLCTSGMRHRIHESKRLPQNIKFVGHLSQEKLIELYQTSRILLFPSRLEGFGYSPLEAHACGLPVVASNSSAIPEVVINNKTGILCPMNNSNAFAEAIERLSNDDEIYRQMSVSARERAVTFFSEEEILPKYTKVIKGLL